MLHTVPGSHGGCWSDSVGKLSDNYYYYRQTDRQTDTAVVIHPSYVRPADLISTVCLITVLDQTTR